MDAVLPPMNPEVARLRRKAAQRKYVKRLRYVRFLWGIVGFLLLLLAIEAILVLTLSPRFWIYRINVSGGETIDMREVITLAAVPPQSNFYRLSLGKVRRRIVTGDPRVRQVTVRRGEVGMLNIFVEERQPVCAVGSALPPRYVDSDGVLFTRPSPPATPVPVVEGLNKPLPVKAFGKHVADKRMRDILACLAAMNAVFKEGSPLEVTRITLGQSGRITLHLRQGAQVLLGAPEDFDKKMFMVQQTILFASTKKHSLDQIEYIDARVPDRGSAGLAAYYKPRREREGSNL